MKKRLYLYTLFILLAGLLSFFWGSVQIAHADNLKFARDSVMETARIFAGLYPENTDLDVFVKSGGETRITIISSEGEVLADSRPLDLDSVENHLDRPEIQAAQNGSPAAYTRKSETLGAELMYYALKVDSGAGYVFIRTAMPITKIDAYLSQSIPMLVALFVFIALCGFFFIRQMINNVTKPLEKLEISLRSLAEGEYAPKNIRSSYEEINKITQNIDAVAHILQEGIKKLRDEKNKLNYIINNIGDGLFAVDENRSIALVNSAALEIFGASPDVAGKNQNYLTYDKTLAKATEDCQKDGKDSYFEHMLSGRIFFVAAKKIPDTNLTTIVLSNITEIKESSKRREEFFANASHELKTPLTAIRGFGELASIHNKDEGITKFLDSIARETGRMLSLLDDMLKLSELESAQKIEPVPVSLAKAATEARDSLAAAIEEKSLKFEILGEATVQASPEHIYELIKNLSENAVRYNNFGGSVSVAIEADGQGARLVVKDNGIGIPIEEQTRIFERFYRVEKSRSQKNGGTGLGLSIVKHICALYGWKLSLKSKLGVGTEVAVSFA